MTPQISLSVANKLKEVDQVRSVSFRSENFISYINAYPWDDTSLSHGYPGLVCLFSEMEHFFPGQGWKNICHQSVLALVKAIEQKGVSNASLFSGLTGICFSVYLASNGGIHYRTLLSKLHGLLLERVRSEYLQPFNELRENHSLLPPNLYDVIVGVSGILSYFLNHLDQQMMREMAVEMLAILIHLAQPRTIENREVPGWFTHPDHLLRKEEQILYHQGSFDVGMAHGIAGCLSALSKAQLRGLSLPGLAEAICRMASWLKDHCCKVGTFKDVWPGRFRFNPSLEDPFEVATDFYRDGWCYGAPGIAFSLFLASKALPDPALYDFSIQIMKAVCVRQMSQNTLSCPSFCHGYAGLSTILYQMYLATQKEIFLHTAQHVNSLLTRCYDEELPFGFKSFATIPGQNSDIMIDNAGLLDGSIGIILNLLCHLSSRPRPWLDLFLLRS